MVCAESDQQTLAAVRSRWLKIVRLEEASQRTQGQGGRMVAFKLGTTGREQNRSLFASEIRALWRVGSTCVWGFVPTRLLQDGVRQPASSTVAATRLTRGVYSTGVETTFGVLGMAYRVAAAGSTYAPQQFEPVVTLACVL